MDGAEVKLPCDVCDADIAIRGAHLDQRFPGNRHFHIGAETVVLGGQDFPIGFHDKYSGIGPAFQANLVCDFPRLRLLVLIDLFRKLNFDFPVAPLRDRDIAVSVVDAKRHGRGQVVGSFLGKGVGNSEKLVYGYLRFANTDGKGRKGAGWEMPVYTSDSRAGDEQEKNAQDLACSQ